MIERIVRKIRWPYTVSLLLIAVVTFVFAWVAQIRTFDPDEFQHAQMAWLIAQGATPFKDFFEHHTPLAHMLAAKLLADPTLTTQPDMAVRAILLLRAANIGICTLILLTSYSIARRLLSPVGALFVPLLLAGITVFMEKGIEIRPDQLSTLFLLLTSFFLLPSTQSKSPIALMAAGICATLAILAGQKALLAMPGFILCLFWGQKDVPPKTIIRNILWVKLGGILALLPIVLDYLAHGALTDFIRDNFLLGSRWPRDPLSFLWIGYRFLRLEPLVAILAAAGLLTIFNKREWFAVTGPLLALVVFMPVFPVVQRQYLFLLLPYLAIAAGYALDRFLQQSGKQKILAPLVALLLLGHIVSVAAYERQRTNEQELNTLRYVIGQTPPDAKILRGWSAGMALRPIAFRYFSLHGEFQALLQPSDIDELAAILQDKTRAPMLVEYDEAMRAMPAPIPALIEKGWEPSGTASLYKKRP